MCTGWGWAGALCSPAVMALRPIKAVDHALSVTSRPSDWPVAILQRCGNRSPALCGSRKVSNH